MDKPTAAEIREWSDVIFAEYGYAEPEEGSNDADRLERKVKESIAELQMIFGARSIPFKLEDYEAESMEEVLIQTAVRMLTEYNVAHASQEIVETVADFDLIASLSVGPISETRRQVGPSNTILHPWPKLNKLLATLLALIDTGTLNPEAYDPGVPTVGVIPVYPKPGADIHDARRYVASIFGDLLAPGVVRAWNVY